MVIAVANHKGGVAKTTSVGALASIFADAGNRVLMVDLDTQANLTYSFVDVGKEPPARYIFDAIRERRGLPRVSVKENLYLVPSGLEMAIVEAGMYSMRRREYILQDLLRPVVDDYDMVFLDCPPSLSMMTTNALTAADRVTVPMNADQLSYYGLKMMKAYVEDMRDLNPSLRIDDVFFTRFDSREKLTRRWEEAIRTEFPDEVMDSVIRKNVRVSEAVSSYRSVVDYMPDSAGARDYAALAHEYIARLRRGR